MTNSLAALSGELVAAVRKSSGAVVAVHGGRRFPSSGVVWRPGVVVTAEHTLRSEDEVSIAIDGGKTVPAHVVGRDSGTDIGVLKIAEAVPPIARDTAPALEPGALVVSVGRSPNAGPVAAMGIIAAVSGPWRTWRGGRLDQYLRLDVGMYPGSSGAVVTAVSGGVAGIATGVLSRVAGLVIPSATLDRVTDEILAKGRVSRGFLGVALQPVQLPEHQKDQGVTRGLIVMTVEPGAPAADAGVLIGDIVVALDGSPVSDTDDVQNGIDAHSSGSSLRLALLRGGKRIELDVTVRERPQKGK